MAAVTTRDDRARRQWPARDRAIVAVLAGVGLRASELCSLQVGDFLLEHTPLLKVAGKGGKERRVPVAVEVATALEAYLAEQAARLGPPSLTAPLFVRANGERMTRQGLNHHVRRWLLRAGVPKPPGEVAHAATPMRKGSWPGVSPSRPSRPCSGTRASRRPRCTCA